jgi:hypothetical protein
MSAHSKHSGVLSYFVYENPACVPVQEGPILVQGMLTGEIREGPAKGQQFTLNYHEVE